jgi:hypothetical protein
LLTIGGAIAGPAGAFAASRRQSDQGIELGMPTCDHIAWLALPLAAIALAAYDLMIPTTWQFNGWVNVGAAEGGCFADWFARVGMKPCPVRMPVHAADFLRQDLSTAIGPRCSR